MPCRAPGFRFALAALLALQTAVSLSAQKSDESYKTSAEVRTALASRRAIVAAHKNDARAYIQLAYTLMDAGLGTDAIEQGRLATVADPRSSFAFSAYGWLLHHNAIGSDYGKGYDYAGSLTAYRRAIELDPSDLDARQSFSDDLRYDPDGVEYGPTAHLDMSIDILKYIQAHQRPLQVDVTNNLAIDLLYSKRFDDVLAQVASHPATPTLDGAAVAAFAALHGGPAAVAKAEELTGDPQRKDAALDLAAEGLWNLRRYSEAADLLTAESHHDNATLGRIQLFRGLKPYVAGSYSATDPRATVERMLLQSFAGTLTDASMRQLYASSAFASPDEEQTTMESLHIFAAGSQSLTRDLGMPFAVLQDLILGKMEMRLLPNVPPEFAVISLSLLGQRSAAIVLMREGDVFRIAGSSDQRASLGEEALALVHAGHLETAADLLDVALTTGGRPTDDALAIGPFPLVWGAGMQRDEATVTAAAAALMPQSPSAIALVTAIKSLRDKSEDKRRDGLDLTLALIALAQHDGKSASTGAAALLQSYPESTTALRLAGSGFALSADFTGWNHLLANLQKSAPGDSRILREQAREQATEGNYAAAQATYRTILDNAHAEKEDHNRYAWLALFSGKLDESADSEAMRTSTGANAPFSALHTLACLDAAEGRSAEARETIEHAMIAGHITEPNAAIWLAYGLLYESYGEKAAAVRAFARVDQPAGPPDPIGSYALAQIHLKRLNAAATP